MAIGKVGVSSIHLDIDEHGVLVMVSDDGRVIGGVRAMTVNTAFDDVSTVTATITIKNDKPLARGMVKNAL